MRTEKSMDKLQNIAGVRARLTECIMSCCLDGVHEVLDYLPPEHCSTILNTLLGDSDHCCFLPLLDAVDHGSLHIVKYLLQRGANVDMCSVSGITAIYAASSRGRVDMVRCLVECGGADVESPIVCGETCLMAASNGGHLDTLTYLIQRGARINVEADCGATAVYKACMNGHREVVEILLQHGADIKERGDEALRWCAARGDSELVAPLLKAGARLTVRGGGEVRAAWADSATYSDLVREIWERQRRMDNLVSGISGATRSDTRWWTIARICGAVGVLLVAIYFYYS